MRHFSPYWVLGTIRHRGPVFPSGAGCESQLDCQTGECADVERALRLACVFGPKKLLFHLPFAPRETRICNRIRI